MRPTTQFECMNDKCNAYVLGSNRQDGLRCPRCGSMLLPKPYESKVCKISEEASYVRRIIMEQCLEDCFELTPNQVETIVKIMKGEIRSEREVCSGNKSDVDSNELIRRMAEQDLKYGRITPNKYRELLDKLSSEEVKHPLLKIELNAHGEVPKVFLNGEDVKGKCEVQFEWKTSEGHKKPHVQNFELNYVEEEGDTLVQRTISFKELMKL